MELSIIPECYVDTKVAEILGKSSKKYNHQHGCGDVANLMKKRQNRICLGIVDEDKNKGPEIKYFSEFIICLTENNLILKRHKDFQQFLILICPEIEKWLLNDAIAVNLDPTHEIFGLPLDLKGFRSISKTKDIDRNEGFKRFVKALINNNAPSVTTLQNWLESFKNGTMNELCAVCVQK